MPVRTMSKILPVDRRSLLLLTGLAITAVGCNGAPPNLVSAAPRRDLYACEGCEGAHERDFETLSPDARIGPPNAPGEPMRIEGRVLDAVGGSGVSGVVIYAYQANADGVYADGSPETEWSRRHGRLRGWVKTDITGNYGFDTIKPAPYPKDTLPAHIHFTIVEPNRPAYYIDDIVFAGEFGVTDDYRRRQELRGGSGIVALGRTTSGRLLARRDIILEPHPRPR